MSDTVERNSELAGEFGDERHTITVSDMELEYLEYLRQHPKIAVELAYRIRNEMLHNALMKMLQNALDAGILERAHR